jgi:plasmid stabilization system protein ParE
MKPQVSARAHRELLVILGASRVQFGVEAERRYRKLVDQAIKDLGANPNRPGVSPYSVSEGLFLYHLRHARLRTPRASRVLKPRHIIVFRYSGERVEVLCLLHDAMDMPSRLAEL